MNKQIRDEIEDMLRKKLEEDPELFCQCFAQEAVERNPQLIAGLRGVYERMSAHYSDSAAALEANMTIRKAMDGQGGSE